MKELIERAQIAAAFSTRSRAAIRHRQELSQAHPSSSLVVTNASCGELRAIRKISRVEFFGHKKARYCVTRPQRPLRGASADAVLDEG